MSDQTAVVLVKKEHLEFQKRTIPEVQDPHYVKVRIMSTGICGSDIHFYKEGSIGPFIVKAPMVMGHESSGVVVEVGDAVTMVEVGDHVAIEPGVPSRYSEETKAGHYNLCPHMRFAATPPVDGTLVEYYVSPEDFVHKVPKSIAFEEAALIEPLSVAVHANKLAGTKFNDTVLIMGAGPIGLVCGQVAKSFGASTILYVDVNDFKLNVAQKSFGATHILNSKELASNVSVEDAIKSLLNNKKINVVLECTGASPCVDAGLKALSAGGTFVVVGMGANSISVPMNLISMGELTIKGCFRYCQGDYKDAVSLVSQGKVDLKSLITATYKFSDAIKAYEAQLDSSIENRIKTVILGPE
ncbi:similar to Saccharomyces cerevisiae YJR159W SOR1 Sorbitol dehydrogenase [Maudiozyma saulgeensis]|uniref:Similar to Saccharomyces cerevisiae YJR159W SOR1 Sorbitol dehydrogenase n=1 Tax=Maudiozyma saulgeensis TaxID=1789683 RepID=A0A1X7R324_9SACH|nr:similar to Saccharomyces cerevisiae YJR159W SOR1 Sorbitol dehydrogenase [Kazachstania saulgeensis]